MDAEAVTKESENRKSRSVLNDERAKWTKGVPFLQYSLSFIHFMLQPKRPKGMNGCVLITWRNAKYLEIACKFISTIYKYSVDSNSRMKDFVSIFLMAHEYSYSL